LKGIPVYMRLFVNLIFCCFCSLHSYAQKEANNWYFGYNAAITFSGPTPIALFDSKIFTDEGSATISDKNGNLLFYTNGIDIWDKTHQVMLNGSGLLGHQSSTQSGIIVPQPGNDSIYYVFTVDAGGRPNGLCYSIVNVNRNSGLGEVIQKNVQVLTPTSEKITAVKHCNRKDIWVITRKYHSDQYYVYLLTSAGFLQTPVISSTGNLITNYQNLNTGAIGALKSSPDGKKLAAAHAEYYDYIELMDFDNSTGIISNPMKLFSRPSTLPPGIDFAAYGVEFSPNSKLLYTSSVYFGSDTFPIYQYDVTKLTEADIQNSRTLIIGTNHTILPLGTYDAYTMQIGPDKKIYVALAGTRWLSVINDPNVKGAGCNYEHAKIALDTGALADHACSAGLPAFIQSYFRDPIIATGNCQFQNIQFSLEDLAGVDSVKWDFGDPASGAANTSAVLSPLHIYSGPGNYTARAIIYYRNACATDTAYKSVFAGPFKVYLGNDTSLCAGDSILLSTNIPGANVSWSTGSNSPGITIRSAGKYWVTVGLDNCFATDTIEILHRGLPVFSLGNDTLVCQNQTIILQTSPLYPNSNYVWSTGGAGSSIAVSQAGTYWLRLTDQYNCSFNDTINITNKSIPGFSLGEDTTICRGTLVNLTITLPAANYLWSTGATTNSISVSQGGVYWLDITQQNCTVRDSITVSTADHPIVSLGKDSTLCAGSQIILNAGNAGAIFRWQDHSSNPTLTVSKAGTYWVKVTKEGCTASDTIKITYASAPAFSLGADKIICENLTILLETGYNNGKYLWQDGSVQSTYLAEQAGKYYVQVSNQCGTTADTVYITKVQCLIKIPNIFTPNNDKVNDVFRVSNVETVMDFRLDIYNRWGQLVFTSTDKWNGWNGRSRGADAPAGGYVYILRYRYMNETQMNMAKGNLLLIR
jgi:gliding motility-associated-like protein